MFSSNGREAFNKYKIPLIIFGAAFLLRLIFFLLMSSEYNSVQIMNLFPDTQTYLQAAEGLIGNNDIGRYDLYLVGPGYPFFLGLFAFALNKAYWLMILVQIILSCLSCVLIYEISIMLTGNRIIGVVAGLLSAFSMTSISLANAVLTETLFFFLFALSLYMFFKALNENRYWIYIVSGITGGFSILVRSVAILFPLLLVIFFLLYPIQEGAAGKKKVLPRFAVLILLFILLPLVWGIRNNAVYGTPAIAGTGLGAARVYLSGKVLYNSQNRSPYEFREYRDSIFRAMEPDINAGNFKKLNDESIDFVVSTFTNYPGLFIKAYFSTILENITSTSTLQQIQLPQYKKTFKFLDDNFSLDYKNPLVLVFFLVGFVILSRKNFRSAIILLMIYVYYALMSGITFGQGSRIFFPAQSAWPILVAIALIFLYDLILLAMRTLISRIRNVS
ncbi:MAG: hypothetical protein CVT49_00980 [candidate division Zixibacteria bacterium HGW-Zixibacteria-1]|nr:MAG: hypothetical protein CVT49_00980 [candidate division Zixibacteria bacterium HGW-Zixibacteria-1]